MKQFIILGLLTGMFSFSCSEYTIYKDASSRTPKGIDLILVPEKYNIIDSDWIFGKSKANFNKNNREIGYTTHYTGYDYDTKIPLLFYGKWFKKGIFSDPAVQQNIVPTLTKILGIQNPAGVKVSALPIIDETVTDKPEIIVTVVIDQGGTRLLGLHKDVLLNFNAIKKNSSWLENTRVGHLDAHTSTGHAAIGTGAYPSENGIIANSIFFKKSGQLSEKKVYQDKGLFHPEELQSDTLADIYDLATKNKSVIISQSYASRASLGMGGHGSMIKGGDKDFVYWLPAEKLKWDTDTKYYEVPSIIKTFDPFTLFQKSYPNGFRGIKLTDRKEMKPKWNYFMGTPAELAEEVSLFMKVIDSEIINKKLDKDGITDIAYLTIKATDATGHMYGQESDEMKEILLEADKQIGILKAYLDKVYGDKYALIITADHGCAPLAEFSGGKKLKISEFFAYVDSLLPPTEKESLIQYMSQGQISLNKVLMKKYNITRARIIEKIKAKKLEGKTFFKDVISVGTN